MPIAKCSFIVVMERAAFYFSLLFFCLLGGTNGLDPRTNETGFIQKPPDNFIIEVQF